MSTPATQHLKVYSLKLIILGGVLAILSYHICDTQLATFFKTPEMDSVYHYSREITNIGLSSHYFIAALVAYALARWILPALKYKNTPVISQLRTWSVFLIQSLIASGILLQLLKICVGRQRPHLTPDFQHTNFHPFTFDWHWQSFPSGHSQVLFTVATVLSLRWPRFKLLFFVLATLLAFTRVTTQQHFLSDVIGGAVLGHLATLWLYQKWPPKIAT